MADDSTLLLALGPTDIALLDALVAKLGHRMGFLTAADARHGIARSALRQGLTWLSAAEEEQQEEVEVPEVADPIVARVRAVRDALAGVDPSPSARKIQRYRRPGDGRQLLIDLTESEITDALATLERS